MKIIIAILATVLVAASALAVDFAPAMVASDAQWVAHMNFDKVRATELGQFMLAEMDRGKCKQKLEETKAFLNMDPSRDIASATIYGRTVGEHSGVSIIDAKYDKASLMDFLTRLDGYMTHSVEGYSVSSWDAHKGCKKDMRSYAIFLPSGMVAVSDSLAEVANAADVLEGKKPSLDGASILNLSNQGQATFMAAALKVDDAEKIPAKAAILRQSESVFVSASESDGNILLRMKLDTADAETALNVDSIARGMLAMMYLQSQEKPDLAVIARGVAISTEGKEVSIRMKLAVDTLIELYYKNKINTI